MERKAGNKFRYRVVVSVLLVMGALSACTEVNSPREQPVALFDDTAAQKSSIEAKRQNITAYLQGVYQPLEASTEPGKKGIAEVFKFLSKQTADLELAEQQLNLAVDQKDAEAMAWLGQLYYTGMIGTGVDKKRALGLFQQAHMLGSVAGTFHLGLAHFEGEKKEEGMALVKAAHEQGYGLAVSTLGTMLTQQQKYQQARDVLEAAVEQGDVLSMIALSDLEAIFNRQTRRMTLLEQAWTAGWPDAGTQLYSRYYFGDAVPKDEEKAKPYLFEAAELGSAEAYAILCSQTKNGNLGLKKDIAKAIEYCQKGVELGSMFAPQILAGIYVVHQDNKQLLLKAKELIEIAVDRGNASAMTQYGSWLNFNKVPSQDESVGRRASDLFERSAKLGWPEGMVAHAFYSGRIGGISVETEDELRKCWFWSTLAHSITPSPITQSYINLCGSKLSSEFKKSKGKSVTQALAEFQDNYWVKHFRRQNPSGIYNPRMTPIKRRSRVE